MSLTCAQMDILISFYIENELSSCLKKQVEEHLLGCSVCSAKYDIIKTMVKEMKDNVVEPAIQSTNEKFTNNAHFKKFKTNLSAYIDNELPSDENIKIKKYTIHNKKARKELQDSYNLRKLMNDSFKKTKSEFKHDFCKSIIKQLEFENNRSSEFNPAISILIAFTIGVLVLTTIVLVSMSL